MMNMKDARRNWADRDEGVTDVFGEYRENTVM